MTSLPCFPKASVGASNALNKWMQTHFRDDIVIHGFRHALRDRLRAVQCPSDMIDQIGGWSAAGIGEAYGEGYGLDRKREWVEMMVQS